MRALVVASSVRCSVLLLFDRLSRSFGVVGRVAERISVSWRDETSQCQGPIDHRRPTTRCVAVTRPWTHGPGWMETAGEGSSERSPVASENSA